VKLEHPEVGTRPLAGVPYSMSLTPCEVRKAAPCLGADTEHVLGALLGYRPDKIAELRKSRVTV
jgi:crotonobetainyl-CoA:carnitine CoA-transferase CaiB-like acyl-CoA transferase